MEFNTLLHIDLIKDEIAEIVKRKIQFLPDSSKRMSDIVNILSRIKQMGSDAKHRSDMQLSISHDHESLLNDFARFNRFDEEGSSDEDFEDAED